MGWRVGLVGERLGRDDERMKFLLSRRAALTLLTGGALTRGRRVATLKKKNTGHYKTTRDARIAESSSENANRGPQLVRQNSRSRGTRRYFNDRAAPTARGRTTPGRGPPFGPGPGRSSGSDFVSGASCRLCRRDHRHLTSSSPASPVSRSTTRPSSDAPYLPWNRSTGPWPRRRCPSSRV